MRSPTRPKTRKRRAPKVDRSCAAMLATLLAVAPATGRAELCTIDVVPAATLLVPYFEVDVAACGSPDRRRTVITVHNTSPDAALTKFTLWTDLGEAGTGFDVYLPGHGSHEVDLAELLCDGTLPSTGSAVSPPNLLSNPNKNFPFCNGTTDPANGPPVYGGPGVLPDFFTAGLRNLFTGQQALDSSCHAVDFGDQVARGFVTVDTVASCVLILPDDSGYFSTSIIAFDNVLLGEYRFEGLGRSGDRLPAVHLEAADEAFFELGQSTFYNRLVAGIAYLDRREPLPTTWAARYDADSEIIVWRDPQIQVSSFACGTVPLPYPLDREQELNFDEDADFYAIVPPPIPPILPVPKRFFAWATQRVTANPPELSPYPPPDPRFDSGWSRLELQTQVGGAAVLDPSEVGQSWVGVLASEASHGAVALDTSCARGASLDVIPQGPLATNPRIAPFFLDGFESGDVSAWSAYKP